MESYTIFKRHLKELFTNHQYEVEMLGVNIGDIGVRSIKKGAATYFCMVNKYAHTLMMLVTEKGGPL